MFQRKTLQKCMSSMYVDPIFKEVIKETFSKVGYIMCDNFFKPEMIEVLSNEIFSNRLNWDIKGPLNKR